MAAPRGGHSKLGVTIKITKILVGPVVILGIVIKTEIAIDAVQQPVSTAFAFVKKLKTLKDGTTTCHDRDSFDPRPTERGCLCSRVPLWSLVRLFLLRKLFMPKVLKPRQRFQEL